VEGYRRSWKLRARWSVQGDRQREVRLDYCCW